METRLPVWSRMQCQGTNTNRIAPPLGLINERACLDVQKRGKHKYCAEESGEFPVHDCQREIRNNLVCSFKLDKPLPLDMDTSATQIFTDVCPAITSSH